jgi:hypothetical protein
VDLSAPTGVNRLHVIVFQRHRAEVGSKAVKHVSIGTTAPPGEKGLQTRFELVQLRVRMGGLRIFFDPFELTTEISDAAHDTAIPTATRAPTLHAGCSSQKFEAREPGSRAALSTAGVSARKRRLSVNGEDGAASSTIRMGDRVSTTESSPP